MAAGQALVIMAAQIADRNFWASTRELEEDELVGCWQQQSCCFAGISLVVSSRPGLEIPNRRVVQEGLYVWERHPAYLGALLWGIGWGIGLGKAQLVSWCEAPSWPYAIL